MRHDQKFKGSTIFGKIITERKINLLKTDAFIHCLVVNSWWQDQKTDFDTFAIASQIPS